MYLCISGVTNDALFRKDGKLTSSKIVNCVVRSRAIETAEIGLRNRRDHRMVSKPHLHQPLPALLQARLTTSFTNRQDMANAVDSRIADKEHELQGVLAMKAYTGELF